MLYINTDGKEIEFSGVSLDMLELSNFLKSIKNSASMALPTNLSEYYPMTIQNLMVTVHQNPNHRLDFQIIADNLHLTASLNYLNALSDSLINFFDEKTGYHDHFHLYHDEADNNLLHHDSYHLIFSHK